MNNLSNLIFDHFLKHNLWSEGKKLLDFQVALKSSLKHFNTFNFHYFEKNKSKISRLGTRKYYSSKVSNNCFYGLTEEFFFYHYTVPKHGIGLRKYFFFSYPMLILYNSIGLYILKISEQFIVDFKKKKNIRSYYGGDLKFNNQTLVLKKETVYYSDHYNTFKSDLKNEASTPENKLIIKLDIQNYFENISITRLSTLIKEYFKPSVLKKHNFDTSTIDLITFYFRFLNYGKDCIPQSDNNLISNFFGYIYLIFGDLIIEDVINDLNISSGIDNEYKIIRYVDDIFISIKFKNQISQYNVERQIYIYSLLNQISEKFFTQLNLRFNSKAKILSIENPDDLEEFLNLIKKVSEDLSEPEEAISDMGGIFSRLLTLIEDIKTYDVSKIYEGPVSSLIDTLKDAYSKDLVKYIAKDKDVLRLLEEAFIGFNFDLFRIYPQPLIILVNLSDKIRKEFETFLINKNTLTTFDRGLIINHLCQSGFKNGTLIDKLSSDNELSQIMHFLKKKKVVDNEEPGYYSTHFDKLANLFSSISLIEQIRMREYAERTEQYSVALNHLLNEIHLICSILESKDIKKYKSPDVEIFLTSKHVPNFIIIKIKNLFDRRNNNPVSHPGSDTRVAWAVSKSEYHNYKEYVGKTLELIL